MTILLEEMRREIGILRHSPWVVVDQSMIDRFADVTMDRQAIHIDPIAAAKSPFGGTIAHGFLTLSLLAHLYGATERPTVANIAMSVNYGFERVRFIHPVRAGSRIRAASTITAVEEKRPGQFQQNCDIAVEIEGVDKPALAATWLLQLFV